jgi:hypothetical protein
VLWNKENEREWYSRDQGENTIENKQRLTFPKGFSKKLKVFHPHVKQMDHFVTMFGWHKISTDFRENIRYHEDFRDKIRGIMWASRKLYSFWGNFSRKGKDVGDFREIFAKT